MKYAGLRAVLAGNPDALSNTEAAGLVKETQDGNGGLSTARFETPQHREERHSDMHAIKEENSLRENSLVPQMHNNEAAVLELTPFSIKNSTGKLPRSEQSCVRCSLLPAHQIPRHPYRMPVPAPSAGSGTKDGATFSLTRKPPGTPAGSIVLPREVPWWPWILQRRGLL
ncbi:UNVERIFIED_CONTAM: hypothetical protein K2H54_003479 [Gekko kuhli]